MRQVQTTLRTTAPRRGLHDVTQEIATWAESQKIKTGLLTAFCRHTSAALTIQENADPDVIHDLEAALDRLAPENPSLYRHGTEGPDDMPAHIKGMLSGISLNIPLTGGKLALGTWQGVFLVENRNRPRPREIVLHLLGE